MIRTKRNKAKILTLEDVSISYGDFKAVKNVFCDFKEGNITSLIDNEEVLDKIFKNFCIGK